MLKVQSLNKKFKNFELKNVSLNLEPGYIMGFIGPNGAGKTTTIKLIMNLIKRDSGSIEIFGLDNKEYERKVKERIGFAYDESYFYEDLTIKQMKNIVAPFYSKWDEKVFKEYMKKFSLDENMKIKTLSKGMKMKFSLSIALSHNADLIIMDEPTSGLDPVFRREILDILYDVIQDENKSIFFSTHITTDLEKIADYITFINDGEIVFSKPKDEILEQYKVIKGGKEILSSEVKSKFIGIRETNVGFEALTDNKDIIKKLSKDKVLIEKPSLEDIMFYTVRR
ncbi:ABC transporter ATP-binding protein [Senegalia massiliensis]|uniref:ABC transporter ATP-binding protein n=1 Tax=Senegalia massiliensis TaxID=1720316 RepID=UPI0010320794|nr:ABC transporter ATP-binding protein [Senegalia massiliensis]